MTALDAVDTETLAAACRTAAASSAHQSLLLHAAERLLAQASWIDGAKVDLDGYDEARAEIEGLTGLLTAMTPSSVAAERDDWRRRYEALRDGVIGLCDERDTVDELRFPNSAGAVPTSHLRAVVARVEES